MNFQTLLKKSLIIASCFTLLACASTQNESTTMTKEQAIDKELQQITVSSKAKELVATEADETKLREELVCKKEKQIGTNFRKKVCYTKAELEAKRKAAKREADELQRQRSLGSF